MPILLSVFVSSLQPPYIWFQESASSPGLEPYFHTYLDILCQSSGKDTLAVRFASGIFAHEDGMSSLEVIEQIIGLTWLQYRVDISMFPVHENLG